MKYLIVDGHEDIAYNMLTFGRDYRRSALETRQIERGGPAPERNGDCTLGWPEYQAGGVGLIFATLFAAPRRAAGGEWDSVSYLNSKEAHALYRQQLDLYRRLADEQSDYFRLVRTQAELKAVLQGRQDEQAETPLGLIMLMEGAEGVREAAELEEWWQLGVHIIGPAWTGTRFCGGTREPGPLTPEGFALLNRMAEIGFVLDLSHMDARACLQALDHYPQQVVASHSNPQTMVSAASGNRHLPDEVVKGILAHDGVIGIVPLNNFLDANWQRGHPRSEVPLRVVAAHMDYVCQMAGDSHHVALGTDFDGGFGVQSIPEEMDTIADLQKLAQSLQEKGYTQIDITNIFSENWLRILRSTLPESR